MARILRVVETAILWVAVSALLLITCAMIGQVVMRYGFNAPLQWSETVSVYALVWIVFPGAAAIAFRDEHISIPSLTDRLSPMGRGRAKVFGRLATLAFVGVVCWIAYGWLTRGSHVMAASLGVSTLWIKLALPLGLGLWGVAALALLIGDLRALRAGETDRFPPALTED